MPDRNALAALIEAVEGGSIAPFYGEFRSALGAVLRAHGVNAYDGSLDAAKELHDALLPGWHYRITRGKHTPEVIVQRDILAGEYASAELDLPARAWLLAVLRALAAKELL